MATARDDDDEAKHHTRSNRVVHEEEEFLEERPLSSQQAEELAMALRAEENRQAPPRDYVAQSCCANCVITTALAGLLCRRGCDANRVVAEFAFFPPKPPTYAAKRVAAVVDAAEENDHKKTKTMSSYWKTLTNVFAGCCQDDKAMEMRNSWVLEDDEKPTLSPHPPKPDARRRKKRRVPSEVRAIEWRYRDLERNPMFSRFRVVDGRDGRPSCRLLVTARQQAVPCFYFEARNAALCVIYFHANATDCGAMLPTYAALRARLGVAVLAIEYTGYGAATGTPSVADTFSDADAAYHEAARLGFAGNRIVLYGQSVGSGPACHLAARKVVAGLVLHSPIASGIRSLTGGGCCSPVYVFACLDPFHNLRELASIECPVFVIHGTHDEEIPLAHGRMLYAAAKLKHDPFWVPGAGHNNVLESREDAYFSKLHAYLQRIVAINKKKPSPRVPSSSSSASSSSSKSTKVSDATTLSPKASSAAARDTTTRDVPATSWEDEEDFTVVVLEDDAAGSSDPAGKTTLQIQATPKSKQRSPSFFKGWWRRLKSAEDHHHPHKQQPLS